MSNNKQDFYKRLKVAGFATFIPIVLISGPIAGYVVGDFLKTHFHLKRYVVLVSLAIGSIASYLETIRLIRAMIKVDRKA